MTTLFKEQHYVTKSEELASHVRLRLRSPEM